MSKFLDRLESSLTIVVALLTLFFAGIWFVYSLDRRVALLEAHDDVHDKQILEIKDDQNNRFNRLEDKIDKIYTIVAEDKK